MSAVNLAPRLRLSLRAAKVGIRKIRVDAIFPPIPVRECDYAAIDEDTYDGAPDSGTRHQVGYGATPEAAIEDLINLMEDA